MLQKEVKVVLGTQGLVKLHDVWTLQHVQKVQLSFQCS